MIPAGTYQLPDRMIPITVDGLKFNVQDGDRLLSVSHDGFSGWWDSPDIRVDSISRLRQHGSFVDQGFNESRMITIGGTAYCGSAEASARTKQDLSALLSEGGTGLLVVDDPWEQPLEAVVQRAVKTRVDWYMPGVLRFQITLLAPDPRKYGRSGTVVTDLPQDTGALVFPLFVGGVLGFGGAGSSSGSVTVTNAGSAATEPVFVVTGPVPSFQIREPGGSVLEYVLPVPAGQRLVLDAGSGRVLLEGYADRSVYLVRREWTSVPPGGSRQYLFSSPVYDPAARLTVESSPAWW